MTYRTFIAVLLVAVFSSVASANDGVYVLDNFTVETAPLWRSTSSSERELTAKPEGAEFSVSFKARPELERASIDRTFDKPIDLSEYSRFEVELEVDNQEAFSHCSFYFHSGDGWYGCITDIPPKRGVMTFRKVDFHIEDSPTGWDKIDGIRISLWRGQYSSSRITYYSLRCYQEPILLLSVPNSEGVVPWVGTNNGRLIQSMLKKLGLSADSITLPSDADESWFKRFDNRSAVVIVSDRHLTEEQQALIGAQAKKRSVPLMILCDDLREKPLGETDLLAFLLQSDKLKASIRQFMLNLASTAAGQTVPEAEKIISEMAQLEREKGFPEFIEACRERHDEELFKAAAPLRDSKTLPFRGWWNHSGFARTRATGNGQRQSWNKLVLTPFSRTRSGREKLVIGAGFFPFPLKLTNTAISSKSASRRVTNTEFRFTSGK